MGVDRVVAQGPTDAAHVEHDRRGAQASGCCGPTEQGAVIKGEAKPYLGPPGDSLHEGVGGDERQRGGAEPDGEAVEAEQHRKTDEAEDHQEQRRAENADGP